MDCIPREVIKSGKPTLLNPLHMLLVQCCEEASDVHMEVTCLYLVSYDTVLCQEN